MIKNLIKKFGRKKFIVLSIVLLIIMGPFISTVGSHNITKNLADNPDEIDKNDLSTNKQQSISDKKPYNPDTRYLDTDWLYRKELTINHSKVEANLTNFPVLIKLDTDADLANNTQEDGDDILFTDYQGNQLNHEIEYFNSSTGDLVCWVNCTYLSSIKNTTIYIYYGNPDCYNQQNSTGVWDFSFVMVQHLSEISGTHYDSTFYNNDGSSQGGLNQNAVGMFDGADKFDGNNDYIDCGNKSSLNISNAISIEAWVNFTELGNEPWQGIITKNDYYDWAFAVGGTQAPGKAVIYISGVTSNGSGNVISTSIINDGKWHQIIATYNGTITRLYVDGEEEDNSCWLTGEIHTSTKNLTIGHYETLSQHYNGSIDEVRISNTARNSAWIKTQYNNQHNPIAFYNIGEEEILNIKPTADFTYTPENPTTQDTIQFTDTSTDPDGNITSWQWDFNDGHTSTQQNPTHQYTNDGTYTVSLTVTDDDESTDEIIKEITVANTPPIADFTYTPENPTTQDTIQFTDTSTDPDGNITSWQWDFNDGHTSTQQNPTHQYTNDGTYTVSLTVTDDDGEVDTISVEIEVVEGDTNPPTVSIIKPIKALYILNFKIRRYLIRRAFIIGLIDIEVDAMDSESSIDKVLIYIDGEEKANLTSSPYTFRWKRDRFKIFGHRHTIKVVAYDEAGNKANDEIKVWKIL